MPFTILDNDEVFNSNQAIWMQTDINALVDGIGGNGVVSGCAVSAQGSPDMTCAVAVGVITIVGVNVAVTAGNVTITTANATNPRIDLVVVSNAGVKSVTAGAAAANPKAPDIPATSVLLAMVYVPANDTTIENDHITDKRNILNTIPAVRGGALAWGRPLKSGTTYYGIPGVNITVGGSGGLTVNRQRMSPFRVRTPITIDAIAMTTVAGSAGTNARCGVYTATIDLQGSGAPIFDTGNISLASTGSIVTVLGTPVTLQPGIYLQAINVDSATPTLRQMIGYGEDVIDPGSANPIAAYFYLVAGVAFGALPSSPQWDTFIAFTSVNYWFAFRISTP